MPLPLSSSHCPTWPTAPSSPTLCPQGLLQPPPPLRLLLSCSSFVSLSSFLGASSAPLCLFHKPLLNVLSGSLGSPLSYWAFDHHLSPDRSLHIRLAFSSPPIPFQLLEAWPCPHPHQPLQLCALQSDLQICPRSLTLYLCSLVWLMRQKVSVPFIRDSQSWEILAENIGQAPHLFARKYPPWASLKS